jgi:hypothetical protein
MFGTNALDISEFYYMIIINLLIILYSHYFVYTLADIDHNFFQSLIKCLIAPLNAIQAVRRALPRLEAIRMTRFFLVDHCLQLARTGE